MLRSWITAAACALAATSHAADFGITPVRLDWERGARSAVVTVANDDERPLRMQLRLTEWTQDASGKDVYADSDDLVYFPRMVVVQPKDRRVVRVGLKAPLGAAEKTYRLFLDEIPEPSRPAQSSGLTFSIRFALPVFLPPAEPQPRGEIERVWLEEGKLRVAVRNPGNQHFRIATVTASAAPGFSAEAGGWYLLAGASRVHSIDIPAAVCRAARRLDVTVKADKLTLERSLEIDARQCAG
jgi:fimbrial chaperone protein